MQQSGDRVQAEPPVPDVSPKSSLAPQLNRSVGEMNERSQALVHECRDSLRAMEEFIFQHVDTLVSELHRENEAFLRDVLVLVGENPVKSAGTGEMHDEETFDRSQSRSHVPADSGAPKLLALPTTEHSAASIEKVEETPAGFCNAPSVAKEASTVCSLPGHVASGEDVACLSQMQIPLEDSKICEHGSKGYPAAEHTHKEERQKASMMAGKVRRATHKGPEEGKDMLKKAVHTPSEILKDKVRTALLRHRYDVKDMYKKTGMAQEIARSSVFELVTLSIVGANAIWIALELDYNPSASLNQSPIIFQLAEHGFCVYFLAELCIRFTAFKSKFLALQDSWFVFDLSLVTVMVFEIWVLNLFLFFSGAGTTSDSGLSDNAEMLKLIRLLRMTRMARMARLLRWMPELMILLKGLWLASRSVFFTLVLLVGVIYIFALLFRQITDGTPLGRTYFRSVPVSMSSLLLRGTLPDVQEWVNSVGSYHILYAALLLVFILLASLTVMNMLVGVLVEVVAMVSTLEKETIMVNQVRSHMLCMIDDLNLDSDGNGLLSRQEFEQLLIHPAAAQFMQNVGVDVVGLVEFSEFIFKDRELCFPEFVELVLQLRGSNQATVKDVVDMRKQMMNEFDTLSAQFEGIKKLVSADALAIRDQMMKSCASDASSATAASMVKFSDPAQDATQSRRYSSKPSVEKCTRAPQFSDDMKAPARSPPPPGHFPSGQEPRTPTDAPPRFEADGSACSNMAWMQPPQPVPGDRQASRVRPLTTMHGDGKQPANAFEAGAVRHMMMRESKVAPSLEGASLPPGRQRTWPGFSPEAETV